MKNIRLEKMSLNNFKGIKELEVNFNALDTNIYGKNGTGKTSIVDAFMWLFFNKDSQGAADFDVKTKNSSGEYLHNLEHSVEAVVNVDGVSMMFKKIFKEKYTKQRGSSQATFTGHTTDYFVDDVPKKKKEFDDMVNAIFDSKFLPIITDPFYFNKKMKWQDRRALLLDICGDVPDAAVIATNSDLKTLESVIATKSIDDYRLQLKSQMKPINDELKAIPIKINEAQLAIPTSIDEVDEIKLSDINLKINLKINELEEQKASIRNGGAIAEKETELIKIKNRKLLIQNEIPDTKKLKNELYQLSIQEDQLQRKKERAVSDIQTKKSMQKSNELRRDELRKKYVETNALDYDVKQNVCPICKRVLPDEQIEGFMEKFNIDKANKLEAINKEGIALKQDFENRNDEIMTLENELASYEKAINDLQAYIKDKAAEMNSLESDFRLKQQPRLDQCDEEIKEIEREIAILKIDAGDKINEILVQINALKQDKAVFDKIKAQKLVAEAQTKRIAELETREKQLADEYSSKEQMLYLTDLFIKSKVEALTDNINNHFDLCKFKLFEEQINGGLSECCEVTVNGVSFSDLNNAMKINAGIDVIETVCGFKGLFMPIFVDNAESVNRIIETKSQQIKLYVTNDESLRIENQ